MQIVKSPFLFIVCFFTSIFFISTSLHATDLKGQAKTPVNILDGHELVQALRNGGYVIYFRHGKTDLATKDTDRDNLSNCATQRVLSQEGREQMTEIGNVIQKLNINVDNVLSSPYCRAIDTAKLAFGKFTINNDLKYTLIADETTTKKRAAALKKLLATVPKAGSNTVLTGHNGNLKEASGIWPYLEGIAIIFKPDGKGSFSYVATVPPTYWKELLATEK